MLEQMKTCFEPAGSSPDKVASATSVAQAPLTSSAAIYVLRYGRSAWCLFGGCKNALVEIA